MKVVIVGSGNVASVLGKKMKQSGIEILQVVSRNDVSGENLAKEIGAGFSQDFDAIDTTADLYMIAVADTFIGTVAEKLRLEYKTIVHTAGSVSMNVLRNTHNSTCTFGVVYPLQSLNKDNTFLPSVPVMLDASDTATLDRLKEFCLLWAQEVALANDEQRLKMHVAAVFSSNFTTFMYVMAESFCNNEQLNFRLLLPLIEETCSRLQHHSPADVQTGPALRRDIQTINIHIDLLSQYPRLQGMYKVISAEILDQQFVKAR